MQCPASGTTSGSLAVGRLWATPYVEKSDRKPSSKKSKAQADTPPVERAETTVSAVVVADALPAIDPDRVPLVEVMKKPRKSNSGKKTAAAKGAQAPKSAERYRQQLIERIKAAGLPATAPDDERLLKEIVFFADRSDISEELTRLQSHFKQFEDCAKSTEPVGRTLDFLAQEMNREINTIGSKANDALISSEVVTLKAELEKFREQAMNVE